MAIARICGVEPRILEHTKQLAYRRQPEYALGFIAWFLMLRLGQKPPAYNIFHLVPEEHTEWYLDVLRTRLDDYRVEKQFHLLQPEDDLEDEFRSRIHKRLESCLRSPASETAIKTRRFDTRRAFQSLCKIDTLLKEAGLQPFLVSGTLLGAVRNKGLIEGDNDMDIGVMSDEATDEKIFRLLVDNPTFHSVYNLGHLVQVTDRNGTVTDIFVHYREAGQTWHGTHIHRWNNSNFELAEMRLGSHTFLVPEDPVRYLDENYGRWKKPVLFWDYAFDTPNHEFRRNRRAVYFLADRIVGEMGKKASSRHVVQSAILELKDNFEIDLSHHLGTSKGAPTGNKPKVVITFGTFDLFHIGHLNILLRAASYGDRLVVGVSSDALNYSKKNIYPVYLQEDRAKIVSAVECVSEVFYEESLDLKRDYIIKYGADVLVMGDDWREKFDHLSDCCEIIYLPRTENISTSETKDSIRRNL